MRVAARPSVRPATSAMYQDCGSPAFACGVGWLVTGAAGIGRFSYLSDAGLSNPSGALRRQKASYLGASLSDPVIGLDRGEADVALASRTKADPWRHRHSRLL